MASDDVDRDEMRIARARLPSWSAGRLDAKELRAADEALALVPGL